MRAAQTGAARCARGEGSQESYGQRLWVAVVL